MKLSERLEALLGRMTNGHVIALQCMEFIRDHGPALAELARSVEDAAVVEIDSDADDVRLVVEGGPLDRMATSARVLSMHGQRVRLVPDSPTPPDPGHER